MSEYIDVMERLQEKPDPPWDKIGKIEDSAWSALKASDPRAYAMHLEKLEDLCYAIDLPEAETIVKAMRPKGQMWSPRQVKDYLESRGDTTDDIVEWYLVMNMVFNDFSNTARKYNLQNDTEFYYYLAKDFITDPDASKHKVEKYFKG